MKTTILLFAILLHYPLHQNILMAQIPFSGTTLSAAGEKAYQTLLTAKQFEGDAIGYSAQPSELVGAYRILMKEPEADAAFKSLLANATPAGQLYALCGIYFTDHEFFLTEVKQQRIRSDHVQVQFGCLVWTMKAAEIVESKKLNAVRLSWPNESMVQWQQKHRDAKEGFHLDILSGGYPSAFSRR
jgi:hypothetical protein